MPRSASYMHTTVDAFHSIDIAWLRRQGARNPGYSGKITWSRRGEQTGRVDYRVEQAGLRLMYSTRPRGGEWTSVNELIPFSYSESTFGHRQWFRCTSCQRRCRILYGGSRFRCRRCVGAVYDSQYEGLPTRISDQRWKIRKRIEERGGKEIQIGDLDGPFPDKPKWMHWKTYQRLRRRDRQLSLDWCAAVGAWMKRVDLVRRSRA